MRLLYSFGIRLYGLGVRVAALCGNNRARLMCRGWQRLFEKIEVEHVGSRPTAWFHASSLGEFEQARPVLEQFKHDHPDFLICLTFFSPSGYEVRKNYAEADVVCYLPLDTPGNARRFVSLMNPSVAFFVKYDHWFNYLNELRKHHVPCYLFSAIFRPNQYFFHWYGTWFCKQLKCYSHLFVQNEESVRLLSSHGIEQVSIAGDTRFDRVAQIAAGAKRFPAVDRFLGIDAEHPHCEHKVLLAGSSWEEDEAIIAQYLASHADSCRLILAPHLIHEEHLANIEARFASLGTVRYSLLAAHLFQPTDTLLAGKRVLLIDNMGMLSSMYQYADVAYIGGGFGKGIHNILEALTFAKPVVFGPNHSKFKEAVDILQRGGGKCVKNESDLSAVLDVWFSNPDAYQSAACVSRQYVEENRGAVDIICHLAQC